MSATLQSLDIEQFEAGTAAELRRNLKTALKNLPQLQHLKLDMYEAEVAEQQAAMRALHAALTALTGLTSFSLCADMDSQQALPLGSCQGLGELHWGSTGKGLYGLVRSLRMAGPMTALHTLRLRSQ